eukprot:1544610-Prymnesium_polylepis.4
MLQEAHSALVSLKLLASFAARVGLTSSSPLVGRLLVAVIVIGIGLRGRELLCEKCSHNKQRLAMPSVVDVHTVQARRAVCLLQIPCHLLDGLLVRRV